MIGAMFLAKILGWLAMLAVIGGLAGGAYIYVKRIGYAECHAQVNAAIIKEFEYGEEARTEAESSVARDVPDVVSNDPRNRDNWKQ
jgi:ABC-type long-subunit fatty acid transport system fused permease/ATPase subunit